MPTRSTSRCSASSAIVGFLLIAGTVVAILRRPRAAAAGGGTPASTRRSSRWPGLGGARRRRLGLGDARGHALALRAGRAGAVEAAPGEPVAAGLASFEPGRMVRIVAAVCIGVLAITPAAIAISQSRLDTAVADFEHGDCAVGDRLRARLAGSAQGAARALRSDRLLRHLASAQHRLGGAGDAQRGRPRPGQLGNPLRAGAGPGRQVANPMPELYASLRLNPLEATIQETIEAMRGAGPRGTRKAGPGGPPSRCDLFVACCA